MVLIWQKEKQETDISEGTPHLTESGKNYTVSYTKDRQLIVDFPCLKEIRIVGSAENGLGVDAIYRLGYSSETQYSTIYVDYYAKVNENAVIDPKEGKDYKGNYNQAQIEYSDNPQAYGDTDTTTIDRATVYTFGLDIVKIDAAAFLKNDGYIGHESVVGLKGAKFVIVRPDPTDAAKYQIAKMAKIEAISPIPDPKSFADDYYSIDEWTDLTGDTATDAELQATIKAFITEPTHTDYEIETADEGKLLVSGLDAGVDYTIVETDAPTDYATINPFTVTLTADEEDDGEYNGKLSEATSGQQKDADKSFTFEDTVDIPTGQFTDNNGSANMLVANFKYTDLPSTGGVGTVWFYILGAGGVGLAGVLFFLSKKKVTK